MRNLIPLLTNWRSNMPVVNDDDDRYGGLTSVVLKKVMEELGITQIMVDKVKAVIDNVDIQRYDNKTVIELKLKNITVVIDK